MSGKGRVNWLQTDNDDNNLMIMIMYQKHYRIRINNRVSGIEEEEEEEEEEEYRGERSGVYQALVVCACSE